MMFHIRSCVQGKYTITHGSLVQGESSWLFRAAWGYRKLLNWVSNLATKASNSSCTNGSKWANHIIYIKLSK